MSMDPNEAAAIAQGEDIGNRSGDGESTDTDTASRSSASGSSRSSFRSMLSSTEPDVSPSQASGTLDTSEPWHAHAETALAKATGAGGTPAWVHLLMAMLLLLIDETGVSMPSSGGDPDDEDDVEADGGVASV